MELMTECNGSGITVGSDDEYTHDATYAHALVMAMEELRATANRYAFPSNALNAVEHRAAELMREWGFGGEA